MPPSSSRNYLVVGDPILDAYAHGRVTRKANEGDFPVYEWTRRHTVPGGALNVALALIAADPDAKVTALVPPLDADDTAHGVVTDLERNRGVQIVEPYRPESVSRPLLCKLRYLDGEQGPPVFCSEPPRSGYYAYGADAVRESVLLMADQGRRFDAVFVSDYGAGTVDVRLMRALRSSFPDARLYLDPHVTSSAEVAGLADVVKLNEREYRAFARGDHFFAFVDPDFATRRIETVVTDGEHPVRVHETNGSFYCVDVPGVLRTVDPCGAGDVFFAYYGVRRQRGETPREAASWAAAAAALSVLRRGNYVPAFLETEQFRRDFARYIPA